MENELSNTRESLNETSAQLNSLATSKRALEADYSSVRGEMDEMGLAMKNSEEKAKRATLDAMKLAEEAKLLQERVARYYIVIFSVLPLYLRKQILGNFISTCKVSART